MSHQFARRNFLGAAVAGTVTVGLTGLAGAQNIANTGTDRVMLFLVDSDLPGPPNPMQFLQVDPGLLELVDILDGAATFESILSDAEAFYLERFGIDFRDVPLADDGTKFHEGVLLLPWRVNPAIRYTATTIGNHGRIEQTVRVRDGGFAAIVVDDGVIFYGEYGGVGGIPALPNDLLAFGAYRVPAPGKGRGNGQPVIIKYGAVEPMRGNADGNIVIACGLLDSPYGPGLAYGVAKFTLLGENDTHVFVRNVLTFPGHLTSI